MRVRFAISVQLRLNNRLSTSLLLRIELSIIHWYQEGSYELRTIAGGLMADAALYDRVAGELRQTPAIDSTGNLDTRALVQYGILAASSHNTQPWTFAVGKSSITVCPDFGRRCPVVDPDDAHLFKSLGCAVENIVLAAEAGGYASEVSVDTDKDQIRIDFKKSSSAGPTSLFAAIPNRQCTKTRYDESALTTEEQRRLEGAVTDKGVRAILLTSARQLDTVAQYASEGNKAQLSDRAFRKELISWIRFNPRDAIKTRDGLTNRTSGRPAIPGWLAPLVIAFVLTPKGQAKTDSELIKSSSAVAVFAAGNDDKQSWIRIGRAYERFALQGTDLDIRHAFINQPLEVGGLRPRFESWLGLNGERAHLMVRLGRAATVPFSLRRPVDHVIR